MKKRIAYILLILIMLSIAIGTPIGAPILGQAEDEADEDEVELIAYGDIVAGQITNQITSNTYAFDALRCDYLSIRAQTISGNLDPTLSIVDSQGKVLRYIDDSNGQLDIDIQPVAIEQSDRYFVTVSRYGHQQGTTSGSYELIIERIGNGSMNGCAMRYGDTVYAAIDNMTSEMFYFFRATEGDIVNITMQRSTGTLDPYVSVVNDENLVIEYNDDAIGSSINAEIQSLLIPETGTYYIIATRYGLAAGDSTGTFTLTIEEAANSGLGNSAQAAIAIRPNSTIEGVLEGGIYEHYYRFKARQNDLITISMTRLNGTIDAYLIITNSILSTLVENDDSQESQNSRIADYLIPADGTYYIIATRFEREAGTTSGRYRLEFESHGNVFDEVPPEIPRTHYGATLSGTIDDVTPIAQYAFWGEAGDNITISMNRNTGDLDPLVSILSDDGRVLLSDDDSGNENNAIIPQYVLPYTGIYYIQATRYRGSDNANTIGGFTLVLAQRFDDDE